MLLKDIPYFVKFTFSCDTPEMVITTTNSEMLKYIVNPTSDEPLTNFEIGQPIKIIHGENEAKNYIIKNISIQHLYDDLERHRYGTDSSDAVSHAGEYKEWLFKVFIEIDIA